MDIIQFDEPAFNVYFDEVRDWGVRGAGAGGRGPPVHDGGAYLLRLRHQGQHRLEEVAGHAMAAVRADLSPARRVRHRPGLAGMRQFAGSDRADRRCWPGKDVLVGVIDVATDRVETPEEVAATIRRGATRHVPAGAHLALHQLRHGPAVARDVARGKLAALAAGAALVRREFAGDALRRSVPRRSSTPAGPGYLPKSRAVRVHSQRCFVSSTRARSIPVSRSRFRTFLSLRMKHGAGTRPPIIYLEELQKWQQVP